ncbi:hypothetical protein, partial [Streptomyces ossamyceticus]
EMNRTQDDLEQYSKDASARWQLEGVAGGYALVNAITRMAVHITADGRLTQYPPDQRPAAVWQPVTR